MSLSLSLSLSVIYYSLTQCLSLFLSLSFSPSISIISNIFSLSISFISIIFSHPLYLTLSLFFDSLSPPFSWCFYLDSLFCSLSKFFCFHLPLTFNFVPLSILPLSLSLNKVAFSLYLFLFLSSSSCSQILGFSFTHTHTRWQTVPRFSRPRHFTQTLLSSKTLCLFLFLHKMGHSRPLFFFSFVFSIQLTVNNVQFKICRWLYSNRGPLVLETTALPTEPQLLPMSLSCTRWSVTQLKLFLSKSYVHHLTETLKLTYKHNVECD